MRRSLRAAALATGLIALVATQARAQERFIRESRTVVAPAFVSWRFADPLAQDAELVTRVSQFALPLSFSFVAGAWTIDAGGAFGVGNLRTADGRTLDLSGPSDVRVRAVGRIVGDQLLLTAGLTLPTGKTGLAGSELDVLRVLATPALGMPAPTLGLGAGGTAGLVYAFSAGDWGLALGSSVEFRGNYSPVESRIAGAAAVTDLRPGQTLRFSLGADRLVGDGKFSLLLATDLYGEDRVSVARSGQGAVETTYRLGPQLSANAFLDLAPSGLARLTIGVADRYRSRFKGVDGDKTPGSSGNLLIASAEATARGGLGVFARLEGRLDSGMEVDQTITTAAATVGTLTFGISPRAGRAMVQPFVMIGAGRVDPGPTSSAITGFGGGITVTIR